MKKYIFLVPIAFIISACESEKHKVQKEAWETIAKSATHAFEPKYAYINLQEVKDYHVKEVRRQPLSACRNRWVMNYTFKYRDETCEAIVPVRYEGANCEDSSSLFFEKYERNCITN